MFENLNFNVRIPEYSQSGGKVGVVEILPGVVFDIHKRIKHEWAGDHYKVAGCYFSVSINIFGCCTGFSLGTPEEVIAYLTQQQEKAPQYAEIKAKRDALSKRIKPLNDKWFKLGSQIFQLAKA